MHSLLTCCAVFLSAMPIEPSARWDGVVADESLRKHAPAAEFVGDAEVFETLWKSWRPDDELPSIDFAKELVLVGVVSGPNRVLLRPTLDEQGDVRFVVAGTKKGGPGFGYALLATGREGVKSVNGQSIGPKESADSITVTVVGTLQTGVIAIGGETTGTTITANGITWELEFTARPELAAAAQKLDGQRVTVAGALERRPGVEIRERWIVSVTELTPATNADVGRQPARD